ncbi:hypothetical protein HYC85_005735 [Camellia sinensis]|uniref:Uncharacterized protein n=1 Tax=Camellia sinensis TaxID=4442 RepID=A0A7J7I0C0_CAMSI|nr:hypothetical protein HYC85_005735 [Camellia sinensis]
MVSTVTLPPKELLLLTSFSRLPLFPSLSETLSLCIGNLPELCTLSLPHNLLSGLIQSQIDNIQSLQILEFQGNNFSGHIPYQITYLSYLHFLNLSYNTLSGLTPNTLIGFAKVNTLDCSNNQLSSPIDLHKFDSLNHLKLSNNYFVRAVPSIIGKCSNLRTLLLDGNIFQGSIPLKLGQIHQLRIFDVSRNSITDRIPTQLANCRKLSFVMLTNLADPQSDQNSSFAASGGCGVGEFNAFDRVNLAQNYFTADLPQNMAAACKNFTRI